MKGKKIKSKISIKDKNPFYVLVTCLLSFGLLGIISYQQMSKLLVNQIKTDAMEIAKIAAAEVDGDKFDQITSEDDEYFKILYDQITKYKNSEQIKYIYTMRLDGDHLIFVVDADEEAPAAYGESYNLLEDMIPAFEGTICCDNQVSADKWGTFFSVYAPIRDSSDQITGMLGCDMTIQDINAKLSTLRRMLIALVTVFFAVCFILYNRLSARMIKLDLLTEIPNYDTLISFGQKIEKSGHLKDYTLMLINIKDFKFLNQQIGTSQGDRILRDYAQYIKGLTGITEIASRTGNDNFIVLVHKENEKHILDSLSDVKFKVIIDNKEEIITISSRFGIYPILPDISLSTSLNAVSIALNDARQSALDYVRFDHDMAVTFLKEKEILSKYEKAIEDKEFKVFYQPKVDIRTNRLCGAEALVRWIKPDGTVVSPGDFIPLLEREKRITELDYYVFRTVCEDIADWSKRNISPVRISSNFSKLHLSNPEFSENVLNIIKKYEVNHDFIEIELTESSGYSDFDALTSFVDTMHNTNIHTSIDDFGTGYSSLSMLKDINVNVVKIDKSFLNKKKNDDLHQEKMLENVIHMITDLDRTVICEGVETSEQLDFLKNAECTIVQGFFFDRPLPHDEFEKRLLSPVYEK